MLLGAFNRESDNQQFIWEQKVKSSIWVIRRGKERAVVGASSAVIPWQSQRRDQNPHRLAAAAGAPAVPHVFLLRRVPGCATNALRRHDVEAGKLHFLPVCILAARLVVWLCGCRWVGRWGEDWSRVQAPAVHPKKQKRRPDERSLRWVPRQGRFSVLLQVSA